jgi:hypothetical protein
VTLVLCDICDTAALWAAAQLQARGLPVDIVFPQALGAALRWEHRVEGQTASFALTLADGRVMSSDAPSPIVNRLSFVPLDRLRQTGGADYGYAMQEMFAAYLSALHAWPGAVINRPTPQGLCGNLRHPSVWATLGARAGLQVRAWSQSAADPPGAAWAYQPSDATAFVVDGRYVAGANLPAELGAPCVELARLADVELLGVDFQRGADGGWELVGASPMPNLTLGGEPLIDALAEALA